MFEDQTLDYAAMEWARDQVPDQYDAWRAHEEDRASDYTLKHEMFNEEVPFPPPADAPSESELAELDTEPEPICRDDAHIGEGCSCP